MNKKKIFLILAIFGLILTFFGGSLAWLQWRTTSEQETEVVFTVEETFSCSADGGGNITNNDAILMPTSSCLNPDYAIQRTIKVNPTLNSDKSNLTMDLWLDINDIGTGLSNSENFRYSLAKTDDSCTKEVISHGTFNRKTAGDKIKLLDQKLYSTSTTDTYYLYIWIDGNETSHDIVGQTIDLSLNGNCTSTSRGDSFYAVYSEDDTSLRFYKETEGVIVEGEQYEGRTATNVYKAYENDEYRYISSTDTTTSPWDEIRENVTTIVFEDEIFPYSTALWFYKFENASNIDVSNLNTSKTDNLIEMFYSTGYNATTFTITGLNNWDVSKVKSIKGMFYKTGYNATTWNIGDLSSWNTESATNMEFMFAKAARNASTFNIGNLNNWELSNVIGMYGMFNQTGYSATTWNIGDLSGWDTSNVLDMHYLFGDAGYNATTFDIGPLSTWDVSNVMNMSYMFASAGKIATTWNIGTLSNWDVSNVTNMEYMFYNTATKIPTFNIGNLNNWNVSNVTNMRWMFTGSGSIATTWNIGNLSAWDVSHVKNMEAMFGMIGGKATEVNIGNLNNWDVSHVTNMSMMFRQIGSSATSFNIGNLSNWDTQNVTNMTYMFYGTAPLATNWSLDLSRWNTSKVTAYNHFNTSIENKVTAPTWMN